MTSAIEEDGGQAFPQPVTVGPNDDMYPAYPGMNLRDYFGAAALTGLLANGNGPHSPWADHPPSLAARAYEIADAMLTLRAPREAEKSRLRAEAASIPPW